MIIPECILMRKSFLVIYLHTLCYEHFLLASLEGGGAQKLSSFMNGTLWEKLEHVWNACDAYNAYFLGYSFWDYGVERGKYFSTSMLVIPDSTPSMQNPITQASLERLITCYSFFFSSSAQINSFFPPSHLVFVFQCKADEARRMRRAPIIAVFSLQRNVIY